MDIAVEAAKNAMKTTWGFKTSGDLRGRMLNKLADLMEQHADELAALESLNTGARQ